MFVDLVCVNTDLAPSAERGFFVNKFMFDCISEGGVAKESIVIDVGLDEDSDGEAEM